MTSTEKTMTERLQNELVNVWGGNEVPVNGLEFINRIVSMQSFFEELITSSDLYCMVRDWVGRAKETIADGREYDYLHNEVEAVRAHVGDPWLTDVFHRKLIKESVIPDADEDRRIRDDFYWRIKKEKDYLTCHIMTIFHNFGKGREFTRDMLNAANRFVDANGSRPDAERLSFEEMQHAVEKWVGIKVDWPD